MYQKAVRLSVQTYSNMQQSPYGLVVAGPTVRHGYCEHPTPPQQGVLENRQSHDQRER